MDASSIPLFVTTKSVFLYCKSPLKGKIMSSWETEFNVIFSYIVEHISYEYSKVALNAHMHKTYLTKEKIISKGIISITFKVVEHEAWCTHLKV